MNCSPFDSVGTDVLQLILANAFDTSGLIRSTCKLWSTNLNLISQQRYGEESDLHLKRSYIYDSLFTYKLALANGYSPKLSAVLKHLKTMSRFDGDMLAAVLNDLVSDDDANTKKQITRTVMRDVKNAELLDLIFDLDIFTMYARIYVHAADWSPCLLQRLFEKNLTGSLQSTETAFRVWLARPACAQLEWAFAHFTEVQVLEAFGDGCYISNKLPADTFGALWKMAKGDLVRMKMLRAAMQMKLFGILEWICENDPSYLQAEETYIYCYTIASLDVWQWLTDNAKMADENSIRKCLWKHSIWHDDACFMSELWEHGIMLPTDDDAMYMVKEQMMSGVLLVIQHNAVTLREDTQHACMDALMSFSVPFDECAESPCP